MTTQVNIKDLKNGIKRAIKNGYRTAEGIAEYLCVDGVTVCETLDHMPPKYWDMVSTEDESSVTERIMNHLRYTAFGAVVDTDDSELAELVNEFLLDTQDNWEYASDDEMFDFIDSFHFNTTSTKEIAMKIITEVLENEFDVDIKVI